MIELVRSTRADEECAERILAAFGESPMDPSHDECIALVARHRIAAEQKCAVQMSEYAARRLPPLPTFEDREALLDILDRWPCVDMVVLGEWLRKAMVVK